MRIKPVKDFPGYYITVDGRVLSSGIRKRRWLNQYDDGVGYKNIKLYKNKKQHTKRIHRLMAIAFLENEIGREQVNHKDGIKTNNIISNLEWATRNENMKHAYDNGLLKNIDKTILMMNMKRVSISKETAQAIRNEYLENGTGQIRLARMFNTNKSTAYRAARNQISIYDLD